MSGFVQETCVNTLDLQPIVSTTLNNDQLLLRANFKLSLLGHTTIGLAFLFFLPAFPVETSNAVPLRCRLRVTLRHLAAPSQCMYRIRMDRENHRQRVSQARMKCGPACRRIGGLGGKFSAYQASEEPELISLAAVHASFCDTCVLAILKTFSAAQEHVVLVNTSTTCRISVCPRLASGCYHATSMAKQCGPHGLVVVARTPEPHHFANVEQQHGADTMGILSVEQTASIRFRSEYPILIEGCFQRKPARSRSQYIGGVQMHITV
ncbi:hypothetical protein R3P38DRAFT_3379392 [Favolaschia claudopus]|uniref:Uncharacterized protein n=1 Tax=Favolaschia claudopus TaxID=2862362 RepID=A0AAV9Z6E2_9AGAR